MRKKSIAAIAASVLCLTAVSASTANASGAAAPACWSGFVCFYQDANAEGYYYFIQAGLPRSNFTDGQFNDMMSSWVNNSSTEYCWYADANFKGGHHYMAPNHGLQNVTSSENDTASSARPAPSPMKYGYYSNDDCY